MTHGGKFILVHGVAIGARGSSVICVENDEEDDSRLYACGSAPNDIKRVSKNEPGQYRRTCK